MKKRILKILQIVLGLFIATIGLNKFLVFTEIPNPPGDGGTLMKIYISSGFLKLIGVLELLAGIALATNKFTPLALVFITAIMFNATVFHGLHDLGGIGPAVVSLFLTLILVYINRLKFTNLFQI
ncbi:MAG: DoxX family protein [bacterium]|nr:DoxX family protein [bacterium]